MSASATLRTGDWIRRLLVGSFNRDFVNSYALASLSEVSKDPKPREPSQYCSDLALRSICESQPPVLGVTAPETANFEGNGDDLLAAVPLKAIIGETHNAQPTAAVAGCALESQPV
jgi:hypothetical protein